MIVDEVGYLPLERQAANLLFALVSRRYERGSIIVTSNRGFDGWHKIGRKFWPGVQAAAYLSSYFAGGRGGKMAITENVLAGDLPRLVVFVGRDLTARSGCTMRSSRDARRLWALRKGLIETHGLDGWDATVAACVLDREPLPARGP